MVGFPFLFQAKEGKEQHGDTSHEQEPPAVRAAEGSGALQSASSDGAPGTGREHSAAPRPEPSRDSGEAARKRKTEPNAPRRAPDHRTASENRS